MTANFNTPLPVPFRVAGTTHPSESSVVQSPFEVTLTSAILALAGTRISVSPTSNFAASCDVLVQASTAAALRRIAKNCFIYLVVICLQFSGMHRSRF